MKTTAYFRNVVTVKRPDIHLDWIAQVISTPLKRVIQVDGRIVLWGNIEEAEGRALRVVLLEDNETVHNAFFDRNFLKRQQRGEESK